MSSFRVELIFSRDVDPVRYLSVGVVDGSSLFCEFFFSFFSVNWVTLKETTYHLKVNRKINELGLRVDRSSIVVLSCRQKYNQDSSFEPGTETSW